ncbi:PhoH family protein [Petroclostridium sp. X23]|uniref:PhoH family protein n=1 Tax=Petroclostridium sp. X23 TaxID=3045146 RepID=UPI0024AE5CD2|nr:PhoH family protein [Petroclostridium sp. X23]WHH57003.1 PhoH family protein [Petroclostridium sp. X23]
MKKTYVLDTNVLLQSPQALQSFGNNIVVLPEVVLEELDKFKKESNELGANARYVARYLDKLREKGRLSDGVSLENGGIIKVEMNHYHVELPKSWDKYSCDNRILQVCKGLKEDGHSVFLITKDIFERIKGDIVDVIAQDFFNEQVQKYEEQYTGRIEVYTHPDKINEFYSNHKPIKAEDVMVYASESKPTIPDLEVNQFMIIHSFNNSKQTALGRFDGKEIRPLNYLNINPFGVNPRNAGQKFMQEALFADADRVPLVIVKGPAGTAKTFYALAVGLHKILEERDKIYRKILVFRPNVMMDEELGFLPGTEEEKIAPFMRPIRDNLEVLIDNDDERRYSNEKELKDKVDELFDRKIITSEAIAYLRGRSLNRHWVIIDEAQNLTPKQVKGIITRAGMGTKIILLGDPHQIDHPFLDERTNGLCYAAEKMKGSKLCCQITLSEDECERSPLAYEAATRM